MQIEFTEHELKILKFYMERAKIDAEGGHAIGITSAKTVNTVHNIIKKIQTNKS